MVIRSTNMLCVTSTRAHVILAVCRSNTFTHVILVILLVTHYFAAALLRNFFTAHCCAHYIITIFCLAAHTAPIF